MAEGLNRCVIIGNLCADPELRHTQASMGVLSVRVAASESWFDAVSKERKERTEFINCTIWGKRGEALNSILHKGSKVCIEGRLQTRTFEDKQGVKQYRTEVVANNVVLLDSKGGSGGQRQRDADTSNGDETDEFGGGGGAVDDDNIPFNRFDQPT